MKLQLFGDKQISIQEQKPTKTTTLLKETPPIPTTHNVLEGYLSNSWNGGFIKPIAYKKIMAGEKLTHLSINGIIRMLTPKVPVAQKLKSTIKCYFVPDSRIWENAAKYQAQRGGTNTIKISQTPYIPASQKIPMAKIANVDENVILTDTTLWRDSYISTYIPRMYSSYKTFSPDNEKNWIEYDWRKVRGFRAIYNDFERHKAYDEELIEFKEDYVSPYELEECIPKLDDATSVYKYLLRGKKQTSYFTNYRTELEGVNNTKDPMYTDLMEHSEWQKLIAESRSQAENEQLRDIDIIAKIRGSKPVTDGQVQFLSMQTLGHNFTQVSQTSYNTNDAISKEYQTLGATGSYSFTEFNLPILNYHEFKEEGYLHFIVQTSADTVFETGLDRLELNFNITDEYRPDLKDLKEDVIYNIEYGTINTDTINVIGFKRKFNEYFKLPNIINGDCSTNPIYQTVVGAGEKFFAQENPILTKQEFQYFETDGLEWNGSSKNIWQDYTDLLINKNQAIQNQVERISVGGGRTFLQVNGQNQMFMFATMQCITDLPIDNSIKDNFKKWGEA